MIPILFVAAVAFPPVSIEDGIKKTGFSYELMNSGNTFQLIFQHDSKNRKVFVQKEPSTILSINSHNIYTQCWYGTEAPNPELMGKILPLVKKFGSFYIYKDSQNMFSIRFGCHYDSSNLKDELTASSPEVTHLKDMIYFVDAVGFEAEGILNPKTRS